jgi:hypothetical protein
MRRFSKWDYSRDLRPAKWGWVLNLRCKNPEWSLYVLVLAVLYFRARAGFAGYGCCGAWDVRALRPPAPRGPVACLKCPKTERAQKSQSEHCAKSISTLRGRFGVSFLVCVMVAKLHCQRKPRTTNLNWPTAPHKSRRNRRSCCQATAGSTRPIPSLVYRIRGGPHRPRRGA